MTTPLQLDSYVIDRLLVEVQDDYDEETESGETAISLSADHFVTDSDPCAHQLVLTVAFAPGTPGSSPYSGEVVGRAFFHVSGDLDKEETVQYVVVNGSAILFGLLRAQVSQVTALGSHGVFLLPTVNLLSAFLDESAEDE